MSSSPTLSHSRNLNSTTYTVRKRETKPLTNAEQHHHVRYLESTTAFFHVLLQCVLVGASLLNTNIVTALYFITFMRTVAGAIPTFVYEPIKGTPRFNLYFAHMLSILSILVQGGYQIFVMYYLNDDMRYKWTQEEFYVSKLSFIGLNYYASQPPKQILLKCFPDVVVCILTSSILLCLRTIEAYHEKRPKDNKNSNEEQERANRQPSGFFFICCGITAISHVSLMHAPFMLVFIYYLVSNAMGYTIRRTPGIIRCARYFRYYIMFVLGTSLFFYTDVVQRDLNKVLTDYQKKLYSFVGILPLAETKDSSSSNFTLVIIIIMVLLYVLLCTFCYQEESPPSMSNKPSSSLEGSCDEEMVEKNLNCTLARMETMVEPDRFNLTLGSNNQGILSSLVNAFDPSPMLPNGLTKHLNPRKLAREHLGVENTNFLVALSNKIESAGETAGLKLLTMLLFWIVISCPSVISILWLMIAFQLLLLGDRYSPNLNLTLGFGILHLLASWVCATDLFKDYTTMMEVVGVRSANCDESKWCAFFFLLALGLICLMLSFCVRVYDYRAKEEQEKSGNLDWTERQLQEQQKIRELAKELAEQRTSLYHKVRLFFLTNFYSVTLVLLLLVGISRTNVFNSILLTVCGIFFAKMDLMDRFWGGLVFFQQTIIFVTYVYTVVFMNAVYIPYNDIFTLMGLYPLSFTDFIIHFMFLFFAVFQRDAFKTTMALGRTSSFFGAESINKFSVNTWWFDYSLHIFLNVATCICLLLLACYGEVSIFSFTYFLAFMCLVLMLFYHRLSEGLFEWVAWVLVLVTSFVIFFAQYVYQNPLIGKWMDEVCMQSEYFDSKVLGLKQFNIRSQWWHMVYWVLPVVLTCSKLKHTALSSTRKSDHATRKKQRPKFYLVLRELVMLYGHAVTLLVLFVACVSTTSSYDAVWYDSIPLPGNATNSTFTNQPISFEELNRTMRVPDESIPITTPRGIERNENVRLRTNVFAFVYLLQLIAYLVWPPSARAYTPRLYYWAVLYSGIVMILIFFYQFPQVHNALDKTLLRRNAAYIGLSFEKNGTVLSFLWTYIAVFLMFLLNIKSSRWAQMATREIRHKMEGKELQATSNTTGTTMTTTGTIEESLLRTETTTTSTSIDIVDTEGNIVGEGDEDTGISLRPSTYIEDAEEVETDEEDSPEIKFHWRSIEALLAARKWLWRRTRAYLRRILALITDKAINPYGLISGYSYDICTILLLVVALRHEQDIWGLVFLIIVAVIATKGRDSLRVGIGWKCLQIFLTLSFLWNYILYLGAVPKEKPSGKCSEERLWFDPQTRMYAGVMKYLALCSSKGMLLDMFLAVSSVSIQMVVFEIQNANEKNTNKDTVPRQKLTRLLKEKESEITDLRHPQEASEQPNNSTNFVFGNKLASEERYEDLKSLLPKPDNTDYTERNSSLSIAEQIKMYAKSLFFNYFPHFVLILVFYNGASVPAPLSAVHVGRILFSLFFLVRLDKIFWSGTALWRWVNRFYFGILFLQFIFRFPYLLTLNPEVTVRLGLTPRPDGVAQSDTLTIVIMILAHFWSRTVEYNRDYVWILLYVHRAEERSAVIGDDIAVKYFQTLVEEKTAQQREQQMRLEQLKEVRSRRQTFDKMHHQESQLEELRAKVEVLQRQIDHIQATPEIAELQASLRSIPSFRSDTSFRGKRPTEVVLPGSPASSSPSEGDCASVVNDSDLNEPTFFLASPKHKPRLLPLSPGAHDIEPVDLKSEGKKKLARKVMMKSSPLPSPKWKYGSYLISAMTYIQVFMTKYSVGYDRLKSSPFLDSFLWFVKSHTDTYCYFAMLYSFLKDPCIFTLLNLFSVFAYAMQMRPRPQIHYWTLLLYYNHFLVLIKCISKIVLTNVKMTTRDTQFLTAFVGEWSSGSLSDVSLLLISILTILWHMSVLKAWGLWHDSPLEVVLESQADLKEEETVDFLSATHSSAASLGGSALFLATSSHKTTFRDHVALRFPGLLATWEVYVNNLNYKLNAKTGDDYYMLYFLFDFLAFVTLLFSYRDIAGNAEGILEAVSNNLLPGNLVLSQLGMFCMIVADRIIYLFRSIRVKVGLQIITTLLYLTWYVYWITDDKIRNMDTPISIQFLVTFKILYLVFSALQIKVGFPPNSKPHVLKQAKDYPNVLLWNFWMYGYMIYRGFPFVFELRNILDWTFSTTSLKLWYWLKLEDITYQLYVCTTDHYDTERTISLQTDDKTRKFTRSYPTIIKGYLGFGLFFLLFVVIFFPLLYYSSFNPALEANSITALTVNIGFVNGEPLYKQSFETTAGSSTWQSTFVTASTTQVQLSGYDLREKLIQKVSMASNVSQTVWAVTQSAKDDLNKSLSMGYPGNVELEMTCKVVRQFAPTQDLEAVQNTYRFMLNATYKEGFRKMLDDSRPSSFSLKWFPFFVFNRGRSINFLESKTSSCTFEYFPPNGTSLSYFAIRCVDPVNDKPDSTVFFYVVSDKVSSSEGFGSLFGSLSITALYTTFVLAVGGFMRGLVVGGATRVTLEDMVDQRPIMYLVQCIYYARAEGDLDLEWELYQEIVKLYRDPSLLTMVTSGAPSHLLSSRRTSEGKATLVDPPMQQQAPEVQTNRMLLIPDSFEVAIE